MTAADRLAELEALHAAATPGEWVHNPINGIHTPTGSCIATTHRHDDQKRRADAALIVAAVNAVPDLIAAVRGVLAVHGPSLGADTDCDECGRQYPCPTVAAVASALDRGPE